MNSKRSKSKKNKGYVINDNLPKPKTRLSFHIAIVEDMKNIIADV